MSAKQKKAKDEKRFCSAVVVAAGSSARMGEDKITATLGGVPVIVRTLLVFQQSPEIDEIVVVTKSAKIPVIAALCRGYGLSKVKHVVAGADNRTGSALAGVNLCANDAKLIAIHDGARPLVTADIIARAVEAAAMFGAAAPAVGVKDTIRRARAGTVIKTLAREELYLMQTPQVFEAALIRRALADAVGLGLSLADDCEAVMLLDAQVHLVEGSDDNIKLTTPSDLSAAKAILESRGGMI